MTSKNTGSIVKDIKRKIRRKFSAEEKISIVLEGLKGEESESCICRPELPAQGNCGRASVPEPCAQKSTNGLG
ncbi:hypothetical protein [Pareuzebyella sediminis]|uniref:hypothetical protein n=1 Tax=Pareuzebyella sediminis TaxID=2607998 RepID=UPI0011EE9339|nr:hypothetical protein [Pareuzebyella sediminis]